MALIEPDALALSLNIDLTSLGEPVAVEQIAAAVALAESIVGYHLEQAETTKYVSGDNQHLNLPTAAPVYDAAEGVNGIGVSTINLNTFAYDAVDAQYIHHHEPSNEVLVTVPLPVGFDSVRVTFTSGWTAETLPADLRDALITLAGFKIKNIQNESSDEGDDGGALKKVTTGAYTEEFAVKEQSRVGDAIPEEVMSVLRRYRRAWAY